MAESEDSDRHTSGTPRQVTAEIPERNRAQCDVEGCDGPAVADLLDPRKGYRCRKCLEFDYGVTTT